MGALQTQSTMSAYSAWSEVVDAASRLGFEQTNIASASEVV